MNEWHPKNNIENATAKQYNPSFSFQKNLFIDEAMTEPTVIYQIIKQRNLWIESWTERKQKQKMIFLILISSGWEL